MVTRTETTMLKKRVEHSPISRRAQVVAAFRQKADGLVMALFVDTNHRRVREPLHR